MPKNWLLSGKIVASIFEKATDREKMVRECEQVGKDAALLSPLDDRAQAGERGSPEACSTDPLHDSQYVPAASMPAVALSAPQRLAKRTRKGCFLMIVGQHRCCMSRNSVQILGFQLD